MASDFAQKGKQEIANQALNLVSEGSLKIMLLDSAYVHDTTRSFVSDATADDFESHEIAVSGYTGGFGGAGRRVPSSRTLTRDDPNTRIEFDFADETWTSLGTGATIGGVGLIVEKTNDADSWVVGFDDLTANVPTNGGDIVYAPDAEGLLQF